VNLSKRKVRQDPEERATKKPFYSFNGIKSLVKIIRGGMGSDDAGNVRSGIRGEPKDKISSLAVRFTLKRANRENKGSDTG